ncbi:hypothetical protein BC828DRAFT_380732 [Blastocladiella britannica]|nr:hypothetical protein BC828DRAFT_380732 [Blastocladiella britannica]
MASTTSAAMPPAASVGWATVCPDLRAKFNDSLRERLALYACNVPPASFAAAATQTTPPPPPVVPPPTQMSEQGTQHSPCPSPPRPQSLSLSPPPKPPALARLQSFVTIPESQDLGGGFGMTPVAAPFAPTSATTSPGRRRAEHSISVATEPVGPPESRSLSLLLGGDDDADEPDIQLVSSTVTRVQPSTTADLAATSTTGSSNNCKHDVRPGSSRDVPAPNFPAPVSLSTGSSLMAMSSSSLSASTAFRADRNGSVALRSISRPNQLQALATAAATAASRSAGSSSVDASRDSAVAAMADAPVPMDTSVGPSSRKRARVPDSGVGGDPRTLTTGTTTGTSLATSFVWDHASSSDDDDDADAMKQDGDRENDHSTNPEPAKRRRVEAFLDEVSASSVVPGRTLAPPPSALFSGTRSTAPVLQSRLGMFSKSTSLKPQDRASEAPPVSDAKPGVTLGRAPKSATTVSGTSSTAISRSAMATAAAAARTSPPRVKGVSPSAPAPQAPQPTILLSTKPKPSGQSGSSKPTVTFGANQAQSPPPALPPPWRSRSGEAQGPKPATYTSALGLPSRDPPTTGAAAATANGSAIKYPLPPRPPVMPPVPAPAPAPAAQGSSVHPSHAAPSTTAAPAMAPPPTPSAAPSSKAPATAAASRHVPATKLQVPSTPKATADALALNGGGVRGLFTPASSTTSSTTGSTTGHGGPSSLYSPATLAKGEGLWLGSSEDALRGKVPPPWATDPMLGRRAIDAELEWYFKDAVTSTVGFEKHFKQPTSLRKRVPPKRFDPAHAWSSFEADNAAYSAFLALQQQQQE